MNDLIEAFIQRFYGYGNLAARFWFIGMEEACGKDPLVEIPLRLNKWSARNHPVVDDLADYHEEIGYGAIFAQPPQRIQSTWAKLIRAVFAANGHEAPSRTEFGNYQANQLGRANGETCLLELFPLPSRGLSHWYYSQLTNLPYLKTRKLYCRHVIDARIAGLQALICEKKPSVVVCYGLTHAVYWTRLLGGKAWIDTQYNGIQCGWLGETLILKVMHPVARGVTNEYFRNVGRLMGAERPHPPMNGSA